jgi:NADH-quinone oxidoreductase subunit C
MTGSLQDFLAGLCDHFGDRLAGSFLRYDQVTLEVKPDSLTGVCRELRDSEAFHFEQLIDLCGVDYLYYGKADWETDDTTTTGFSRGVSRAVYDEHINTPARFAVAYQLLSLKHNRRLRLRCWIDNEPPRVASVVDIWASANWFEREAFDLYGIMFSGHPDLRRILTDYGFIGHPFRKDFPLIGQVEMRYDAEQARVIYEPVSIDPRTLVPRVIREDNRYQEGWKPEAPAEEGEADA